PGSLRLNGAALTEAPDGDAGSVQPGAGGRQSVEVRLGALAPGASGTVAFAAVVEAEAATGTLANVAALVLPDAQFVSLPAETRVATAQLELSKQRMGSDSLRAGEEVTYRIGYANRSSVAVRNVVLTDTLAAELAFVSAEGQPEVQGQVVRWTVGTVQPGQSGTFALVARVQAPSGSAARTVTNRVFAQGSNAAAVAAEAVPVTVVPARAGELEVSKAAGVLEAGVGETVPYTLVLRNRGGSPLGGIVLHDRLPRGVRLVEGSVRGADSVRVEGREVRMVVVGPLAAGAEHAVRYSAAVVSPGDEAALGNQVWAEAPGAHVRSDTAVAWVRLRRGFAMQGRTLVGKVWLDEDGDGRQDPGEEGVPGASVWSADGEVVTTDRAGRFSFRDLRPGTHVLRLDTLGLPRGYTVPRRGENVLTVRMDGWTTPRAAFRLVRLLPAAAGADGAPASGPMSAGGEGPVPVSEARARRAAPRVEPLRTAEERETEQRNEFLDGPAVQIMSPADGTVIGTNRLYVGIRGEPGAQVRLYDGEKLIQQATLRPDGLLDIIGVEVSPGPHRLRVWMRNSWERERWDSVAVHRSGEPATIVLPARSWTVRADTRASERLRLRVLDHWQVPVADSPSVTLQARGVTVDGEDVDSTSVGMQLRTGADGLVEVVLRGGRQVGTGELVLTASKAAARLPIQVLPFVRPLIATGAAQVGVGASPEAFGAVTVQGAIGRETSVSISYDSRRSDPGSEFFGRGYDPLDEARYPTLGDGSERRVLAGATQTLSARVERGFDWLELGDVQTPGFGGDGSLGAYRRALTGVSGRVTTGPLVWNAFGSVTDQALEQHQIRGDGSSGPYRVGGGIRPGTERIAIEVRAADNAARVIAREELTRFVDYQIDYLTGVVLLQRPVPATDPQGNPVFVVAGVERRSGGESRFVGGMRMELDAARLLSLGGVDSLGVAVFGIRDAAGTGVGTGVAAAEYDLVGGDVRVRRRGLELGAELLRSVGDSTATAGRAEVAWALPGDRVQLEAGWLRVGDGFAASANPRLASGLEEIRLQGEAKLGAGSRVRLRHERQNFTEYGVERSGTYLTAEQAVRGRTLTAEGGVTSDLQAESGSGSSSSAVGKVTLAASEDLNVWVEGSHLLSATGTAPTRPDHVGAGASYRVLPRVRLEGSHRWIRSAADSGAYSLSSMALRMESVLGGQVWGGMERADGEQVAHSLAMGWSQRLSLAGGWSMSSLFERRFGLSHAPLVDPLRALPFARPERDRWSAGLGLEWLPADSSARFSARGELHDGTERSGYRFDVAGDLPMGPSAALLTRHDWSSDEWGGAGSAGGQRSRRDRSLLGLALRPVDSDAFNALAKVEWRRTANPLLGGDVLTQSRDETRLIGSADAVWAPAASSEFAARYAVRLSMVGDSLPGAAGDRSLAHYLGGRWGQLIGGSLSARVDGRVLVEGTTRTVRWSAAPSLVFRLGPQLELEGGYRLGDLRDPDFYASGGAGFFATLGLRFTEGSLGDAAAFWRQRVAQEF
ncbi:MAG TPA: SdrD B-like domain-containing protein, partial [Longimicrobiaceae bacterium]|nr:SdrD B-like domain-containing protein [Longimicrobiaceae bacterium]